MIKKRKIDDKRDCAKMREEEKRKKRGEDAGWPLVRGPEFDRCFQ